MTTRRNSAGIVLAGLMAAAMFLGAGPALAQQAEEGDDMALKEIEVRSAVRREELKSTSATVLESKDIEGRIYPSPLYILRQSPGVSISSLEPGGVVSPINIRGFGGAHGGDVGFFMDGIPLNGGGHADNYADPSIIIPLEVESVEIIKGPASVLYGKGSAGGVAAFQGIKQGDFNRFNLRYGSFNTVDGQGLIAKDDGALHHVYAFQAVHTDGWRDSNSEWNRYNLSTRWTYDVGDQFKVSLGLRAAQAKWDSATTTANWAKPESVLIDDGSGEGNISGGYRNHYDARLWANYMMDEESQFTLYTYTADVENSMAEMYPAGPKPSDKYVIGEEAGSDQINERRAYGTGLVYNHDTTVWDNHELALTLGMEYLKEKEHLREYDLLWGSGKSHGPQFSDADYTLNTWSLFGQGVYQLFDPLKVRLGLRYDRIGGEMDTGSGQGITDALAPNKHYTAEGQGILSPKFGLLFSPWGNTLELYTNYGRGYTLPGLQSGEFFGLDNLKPAKRDQYELGFRSSPLSWLDVGSAVYLAYTRDDFLRVEDDKGKKVYQNAGKTQRKGIESNVKFHPLEHLTLATDYTYQVAEYKKNPANPDLEGRRFRRVPKHVLNLEAAYAPPEGMGGRASFNWNADIVGETTPPYRHYDDYGTLDLQANYRFNEKYKINLDVTNALDSRPKRGLPKADGSNGPYYTYWPTSPREFFITFEADFL